MQEQRQGNRLANRQGYFEGWHLLGLTSLAMAALAVWLASMRGFEVDGVRMVVRFTARTSLLFFCLAFSASALHLLWESPFTRWQLRNRRYLGLSFAVSHLIHAIAIACFAAMAPPLFAEATTQASFIFGGIGYAFIIAMAATSFDRAARAIGSRAWRILHMTGVYYLSVQFMISFGMRIPAMPNYAWFLAPLIAVMALRIAAALRARRVKAQGAVQAR
jgi:methionine sulfoxide reductase heme-binding subunit